MLSQSVPKRVVHLVNYFVRDLGSWFVLCDYGQGRSRSGGYSGGSVVAGDVADGFESTHPVVCSE